MLNRPMPCKRTIAWVVFLLIIGVGGSAGCARKGDDRISKRPESLVTEAKALEICRAAVERCNRFLHQQGFEDIRLPGHLPFRCVWDRYYREKVVVLGDSRSPVEIKILTGSRKIVFFNNCAAYERAFGEGARRYDSPRKAKWSRDKAVVIARGYVEALLGEFPKNLHLAVARFKQNAESPKGGPDYYYAGDWFIGWARTDSHGREFMNDGVVVQMTEECGPEGIGVNLFSRHTEGPTATPTVSRTAAIEKSRALAEEIMSSPLGRKFFRNYELRNKLAAELKIVNPNHITRLHSTDELGDPGDQNARLAWMVTWQAVYTGLLGEGGLRPTDSKVSVWIDAETGESLGGDFTL